MSIAELRTGCDFSDALHGHSRDTRRMRGFTLMEMVMVIVVLSVGLAGVALALRQAVGGSASPVLQRQVIAIADSLMSEILLLPYSTPSGESAGGTRATFNSVSDWNGYTTTGGVTDIEGVAIPSLTAYNVQSVSVVVSTLNGQPAKLVTITVTGPGGTQFVLDGYKLDYP